MLRLALIFCLCATLASAQTVLGGISATPRAPTNSTGQDGQWFMDFGSGNVYGPKQVGQWPPTPTAILAPSQIILAPTGPGTDATAAIQSQLNSAAAVGAPTTLLPGSYNVTGNLVLPSGTYLTCAPGATIYETLRDTIFINTNAQRNWATDFTAANRTTATDHDITVINCTGNFSAATATGGLYGMGPGLFAIMLAQRVHLIHNSAYGDTTGANANQIPNLIRIQKTFDSDAEYNYGSGVYNGIGIWGGAQNVFAHHNTYFLAPNLTNLNPYSCSNINGVGTAPGDHQITSQITYSDNICYTAGGADSTHYVFAYNNGTLSSGSQVNDLTFANNRTYASGSNNACFDAKGAIDSWRVTGNVFSGCDRTLVAPQTIPGLNLGARAVGQTITANSFTTTNGSSLVTVAIPTATTANISIGNYINLNGATAVGGIPLTNGFYPITAVAPGTVTFDSGTVATSSATGGGTPTVSTYWGNPRNTIVANNSFINVNALSSGMISVAGPNNTIANNTVEGGTYGSLTLTSYQDCCTANTPAPPTVYGNTGLPGPGVTNGVFGWAISGDGFNSYQTNWPPNVTDYALTGTWTPSLLIGGSATGITYGTQTGTWYKTGSTVQACASIVLSSKGAGSGAVTINGLPFTQIANQYYNFAVNRFTGGLAGDNTFVPANLTITTPFGGAASLVLWTDKTQAAQVDATNLSNSTGLYFCGVYPITGRG